MLNELNKPEQNALGDGTTAAQLGAKIAWQAQTLWLPYLLVDPLYRIGLPRRVEPCSDHRLWHRLEPR